jgi:hypothetical protein
MCGGALQVRRGKFMFKRAMFKSNQTLCALLIVGLLVSQTLGGIAGLRGNSVGGVSIDTNGVLASAAPLDMERLDATLQLGFKPVASELNKPVELRKISLKAIEAALRESKGNKVADLPDEIKYLAGIQRIQFVLLYPEQNDIVLAGPGEGWKLDGKGNVVGNTTNRPVLNLEDLIVAFRTVEAARQGNLSCSIDPTADGRRAFEQFMKQQTTFNESIPAGIERAMGLQQISVNGVPDTSHFARVLVAADYKMKRIGMKLEKAPVKGLASYIDMAPARVDNMMPRWWMACNYEPLGKSDDGLAWELRGSGVKVMTEDEFVDRGQGTVKGSGKTSPAAQKWSEQFTAKYDELAAKESVFGDLRNIMDMCVVAALVTKENLQAKAQCELPELTSTKGKTELETLPAPKKVATQSSAIKRGSSWIITASGGVAIDSWHAADKAEVSPAAAAIREKAKAAGDHLWWN